MCMLCMLQLHGHGCVQLTYVIMHHLLWWNYLFPQAW